MHRYYPVKHDVRQFIQGVHAEVTAIRRLSDHRSEPVEQQPENGLGLALGPAQVMCRVIKDDTGGAAIEAAPGTLIELVGGDFHRQGKVFLAR